MPHHARNPRRIKVKAKPGRIARESPRGPIIPDDRFVTVEKTSYIRRLIEHHQDVEVEPKKRSAPTEPSAPKPEPALKAEKKSSEEEKS